VSNFIVGNKIKFAEEKQAYTIMAAGSRYLVCTKPFNPRKTVLYTVVDLEQGIRGTENLILGAGAETKEDCGEMLARLEGRAPSEVGLFESTEVSYRNRIALKIEKVIERKEDVCKS
jgi:hypothetical protein